MLKSIILKEEVMFKFKLQERKDFDEDQDGVVAWAFGRRKTFSVECTDFNYQCGRPDDITLQRCWFTQEGERYIMLFSEELDGTLPMIVVRRMRDNVIVLMLTN
jgi:hypothetical protein